MALNVIALISGGKDSFFSMLHCLAQGHKVIALANLHPPSDHENEDIDSYMYQTVGSSAIPLYEEALGLPLYRQQINGGAKDTSRDYRAPSTMTGGPLEEQGDMDETEDLIPLLRRVMEAHPEANAISTGAILSTYQRTRVESVALRMGLVPLSYLWQFPSLPPYTQSALLHDMQAVSQDARIIKVASGGLDERFLGLNVADEGTIARLVKSAQKFGEIGDGAILGEGGEFETLAVDGPWPLWRKRMVIEEKQVVTGEGGSAVLRFRRARLENKEPTSEQLAPRIPDLLDDEFRELLLNIKTAGDAPLQESLADSSGDVQSTAYQTSSGEWCSTRSHTDTLYMSNIADLNSQLVQDQMRDIIATIKTRFQHHDPPLKPSQIVHTTLLLRSTADFILVNSIYGLLFTEPLPPARVTVACGDCMPDGVHVMMSIIVDLRRDNLKTGLHVQSRSYWAPANIGPYSQAITTKLQRKPCKHDVNTQDRHESATEEPGVVHIAGQIPLIPTTMNFAGIVETKALLDTDTPSTEDVFLVQVILSLQHLWRIGRATGVKWWTGAVAFLSSPTFASTPSTASPQTSALWRRRAAIAMRAWRDLHRNLQAAVNEGQEEEDVDVWDIQNRITQLGSTASVDGPQRSLLPAPSTNADLPHPPVFAVQVDSLPRGADVEWVSSGLTTMDLEHASNKLSARDYDYSVEYMAIESLAQWDGIIGRPPNKDEHRTILLSPRLMGYAGTGVDLAQGVLIPCKRVWREGGIEILALIVRRWHS